MSWIGHESPPSTNEDRDGHLRYHGADGECLRFSTASSSIAPIWLARLRHRHPRAVAEVGRQRRRLEKSAGRTSGSSTSGTLGKHGGLRSSVSSTFSAKSIDARPAPPRSTSRYDAACV